MDLFQVTVASPHVNYDKLYYTWVIFHVLLQVAMVDFCDGVHLRKTEEFCRCV
jgi:hypothetical protein